MKDRLATDRDHQVTDMKNYYTFQAKIYDFTRWTFLYGRNTILKQLPLSPDKPARILEVGCGTGVNLKSLANLYPKAELYGLDVSGDMLNQAEKNLANLSNPVTLLEEPYEKGDKFTNQFDVILFSYSLTMINPQWRELLEQAPNDLKEGGMVAVVDFHKANLEFYRTFMRYNHVRLDGQLAPVLMNNFQTHSCKIKPGMLGVWEYLMYIGYKPKDS